MEKSYILNQRQVDLKLKRLALEILERNTDTPRFVLAGVAPNGLLMANRLEQLIKAEVTVPVEVIEIQLDKKHPEEITLDRTPDFSNCTVVLMDDVANSGKTLTYALKPFLNHFPNKIQTCILVERSHKRFPIQADFVGFTIASTLQEYIEVEVVDGVMTGAWMA